MNARTRNRIVQRDGMYWREPSRPMARRRRSTDTTPLRYAIGALTLVGFYLAVVCGIVAVIRAVGGV